MDAQQLEWESLRAKRIALFERHAKKQATAEKQKVEAQNTKMKEETARANLNATKIQLEVRSQTSCVDSIIISVDLADDLLPTHRWRLYLKAQTHSSRLATAYRRRPRLDT